MQISQGTKREHFGIEIPRLNSMFLVLIKRVYTFTEYE